MEGIWPLVVIWVLFALFGSKKKKPTAQAGPPVRRDVSDEAVSDRFARALAELKQAEAEAQGAPSAEAREDQAKRYLAEQRRKVQTRSARAPAPEAKPAPSSGRGVKRPVRPLEPAESEMSSEVMTAEGVADYDEEAAAVAAARIQAAARRQVRRDESLDELSDEQRQRRSERPAIAIGGRAEHEAWHGELRDLPPPAAVARAARPDLRRWADGSLRGAVVLSELLGRPVAER